MMQVRGMAGWVAITRFRLLRLRRGRGAARASLWLVVLALTFSAAPVRALDQVRFRISADPPDLRDRLVAASGIATAARDGATEPAALLATARADYGKLLTALYGAGHYSGVISILIDGREAAAISPLSPPTAIGEIVVSVDPGPPFVFGRAEVAPLAPGSRPPEGFASGRPARSDLIGAAASAAVSDWRAAGNAKAAIAGQRVTADHRARTLDAVVAIDPGRQLRFGAFTFTGNDRLRDNRLRKIAGFPTGEVFDPDKLRTVNTRLLRSGVFRSVALREAEAANPDGTLDFAATVIEEAPRRIGFGGEIASFDGLTVGGFWLHRNLFGGAERLRIDGEIDGIGAQLGGTDFRLSAVISRPASFTPDTTASFGIRAESLDQDDFDADIYGLNFGVRHIFSDRLTATAGIDYTYSDVTDLTGTRTFETIALPLGVEWDRRDVPLDATRGFFLSGEVTPFIGLSGTGTGVRAFGDARVFRDFGGGRFVLAGRAQAGTILGATLRETPRDMLFYSGGGGTVRGQPFQSLGVFVLRADQRSGGASFFATSGELRVGVTDTIGVVGFIDTGFVSAEDTFSGPGDWHSGAGIGLRYKTGIGPIRFDVAAPVSGDTGEGVQFYLGIGQAF